MTNHGSRLALTVLVALIVLSPWAFGGTPPWAARALSLVTIVCSCGILAWQARRRSAAIAPTPFLLLFGLVAFAALQLVPLPPSLHFLIAPGSASLWHPAEAGAAAVLGPFWRPISVSPAATWQWLGWTLGSGSLAALALPALADRRRARRAAVVVVSGGLLVAVYGVVAHVAFGSLLFGRIVVPTVTPFGPFVSKNHFAGYVEMIALVALGLAVGLVDDAREGASPLSWARGRRAGRVVVAFGASAALALAVLVSQSRGGAVSLAAGVLAFAALRVRVRHLGTIRTSLLAAGSLCVATALWVALPSDARDRIASLGSASPDDSGIYRIGIWRDSLRVFRASPLVGQGLGAFEDALPRYKTVAGNLRVGHAENDYLELLADAGTVGWLLAFLGLVLLVRTAQAGGAEPDRLRRGLRMGAASGLVALAVHSAFDFNLRIPASAITGLMLVALLLSAAPGPPEGTLGLARRGSWAALGLASLLGAAGLGLVTRSPQAGQTLDALRGLPSGALPPLRAGLTEAMVRAHLRTRPGDSEAWVLLAWLRLRAGSRDEGIALAHYASTLDPTREALRIYSEGLRRDSR